MMWLIPLALIVAGVIAASSVIISKLPQAKDLIDKLAPIQGFLGIGLLVVGVIKVIWLIDKMNLLTANGFPTLWMLSIVAGITCAVLLGFFLGMPLIAKWIPGESPAEQKAMDMQKKIVPYQALLGGIAIVAAILLIYYNMHYHDAAKFLF
jgi:hypothetical protein